MKLLKRKYSILWFVLSIITFNISNLFLGSLLDVYKEDAWYTKWYYWVLGVFFGIIPALVMLGILILQINVKIAMKFNVAGENIYGYPYVWIGCLIIPVLGWTIFIILALYIYVWIMIGLFSGKGEKYIK